MKIFHALFFCMKINYSKLIELLLMKMKYATTSLVATGLDFGVFFLLVKQFSAQAVVAQPIAYTCGMLLNFLLQKQFIFDLNRKLSSVFLLSMALSFGGMALSTLLIYLLGKIDFLSEQTLILKIVVTAIVFFYNFYSKRYAFEKRFV